MMMQTVFRSQEFRHLATEALKWVPVPSSSRGHGHEENVVGGPLTSVPRAMYNSHHLSQVTRERNSERRVRKGPLTVSHSTHLSYRTVSLVAPPPGSGHRKPRGMFAQIGTT